MSLEAVNPATIVPPTNEVPKAPSVAAPPSEAPSKGDAPAHKPAGSKPAKEAPSAASLLAPQRYIPGAPQADVPKPKALKQKKKKGKKEEGSVISVVDAHNAALIETAPDRSDIEAGAVADELLAGEDEIDQMLKESEFREETREGPSPAVMAVEKKLKNLQERIARAKKYAEKSEKELNEDQKILRGNLPTLEATLREVIEIKTAVESHEAKHEATSQAEKKVRRQDELAKHRQAIRDLLSNHENKTIVKIQTVLSFISLSSSLTHPSSVRPFVAAMDDLDRSAISKAAAVLLGENVAAKEEVITGLINDRSLGEIDGIPFKRLRDLATSFAQPLSLESLEDDVPNAPHINGDSETAAAAGNGITFTTESELEAKPTLQFGAVDAPLDQVSGMGTNDMDGSGQRPSNMDGSIEIIEGYSVPSAAAVQQEWVEVEKEHAHSPVADRSHHTTESDPQALDWADDDGADLPSIDTLHAKFGTSGDATPVDTAPASASASMQGFPPHMFTSTPQSEEWTSPSIGGTTRSVMGTPATPSTAEEDGWTPAQGRPNPGGHRGRGFHRGGHPSYDGGSGFRGGERGSGFRGRGRGDFRGGYRGGGGSGFGAGWRANGPAGDSAPAEEGWTRTDGGRGGRGGYDRPDRGRGRGEWRGDGDRRGRGSGFRGRPPPPQAPQGGQSTQ